MNVERLVAGAKQMDLARYCTFILFVYGVTLLPVNKAYNVVPILLVLPALYLLLRKELTFTADLKALFIAFIIFLTPILISILIGYSKINMLDRPVRSIFFLLAGALIVKVRPRQSVFFAGLAVGLCVALVMQLLQVSHGLSRPALWSNPIPMSEIVVALFAMLIVSWGWKNGPLKWLALLGQVSCLPFIMISQTRGTFLSLLSVFLFVTLFYLLHKMIRKRVLFTLILGLALSLALVLGQTSLGSRFDSMLSNVQNYQQGEKFTSTGIRLELWKESLLLAAERPLTGYGSLGHRTRAKEMIDQGEIEPFLVDWAHFHSDYFDALATRGIPGLLSVISLYLIPLIIFFRHRGSAPFLSLAAMSTVVSFMVSSLTDVPLKNGLTSTFFFMAVVIMTAFLNAESNSLETVQDS